MIVASRRDEPTRREDERATPRGVAALLARIEAQPLDAYGAFAFGGTPPAAMIRIERRRVCWATSDSASRLLDRLRHDVNADARTLEAIFRESRERGIPLGQILVARGLLSPQQLRNALLEHTARTIAQIVATHDAEPSWISSREATHDARFTFSPAELLAHIADAEWGPLAQLGREELSRSLAAGGRGCAFVGAGDDLLPVGLVGEELEVEDVLALGAWARSSLVTASRIGERARFVSATRGAESLVAWTAAGFVYAAVCVDRSDLACILASIRTAEEESR